MIVNPTEQGWEVIYHRAHALLAAQIAARWRTSDDYSPRLIETIAAISHHDDLEREWQGDHLSPVGAPLDFSLQSGESGPPDLEQLRSHLENARYRGRWVALLTSLHISFLYEALRGNKQMDSFLNEQRALQKRWCKELKIAPEGAERAYAFLQWCDRLSLILCMRQIPERERALEISIGPDGKRYDIRQRPDGALQVEPWPFDHDRFSVCVEATYLEQVQFNDNAELVAALQQAPVRELEWVFERQS